MATLIPPDPAAEDLNITVAKDSLEEDVGIDGSEESTQEDDVCTREHCFHAFDALYCALTHSDPIAPTFADDKYPLFVTWNTRSSSHPTRPPRLRGCIGTFEAQPIHEGLAEYALISAFKDNRFNRIEKRELPNLECGISLLTDFEDAKTYLDWTVGVHGIHITFNQPSALMAMSTGSSGSSTPYESSSSPPLSSRWGSRNGGGLFSRRPLSACYLPDVAPEQGWDRIETIDSAIRKAGWDGRITEDLRRSIKLRRYQSRRCIVGYDEYVQWRKARTSGL